MKLLIALAIVVGLLFCGCPKKEQPKQDVSAQEPTDPTPTEVKKDEAKPADEAKVEVKKEEAKPVEVKKEEAKPEAKAEVKVEPKKEEAKPATAPAVPPVKK